MVARPMTKTAINRLRRPFRSSQNDGTPISPPSRFSSSYLRPDSWRSAEQARADKWAAGSARRLEFALFDEHFVASFADHRKSGEYQQKQRDREKSSRDPPRGEHGGVAPREE